MNRVTLIAFAAAIGACEPRPDPSDEPPRREVEAPAGERMIAIAVIHPTAGNHVHGTVRFEETTVGVNVNADIGGLEPNTSHGFHIHEFGDCSAPDAESAGDHFAPQNPNHALPPHAERHAGDMGNLQADDYGTSEFHSAFTVVSLRPSDRRSIIGRAVIVHEKKDDGTQPSGNAGARVACGVIGLTTEKEPS